jgi:hypothetical protein
MATSSIYQWEKRIPRRIWQSGSALRKLISSRAAAGEVASSEANGQMQLPHAAP